MPRQPLEIQRPTLFCIHGLGMSARLFDNVAAELADQFEIVAIDLPGFGVAPAAEGLTVDEMVEHVTRRIRRHGSSRFALVGHSMGGKIATLVAARALAGEGSVFGLAGVVLLAGSPPSPEPMPDEQREQMLTWARDGVAGGGHMSSEAARQFVDGNVGGALDAETDARAIEDVRRSSAEAWLAWFERGSREDREAETRILNGSHPELSGRPMPALIVAGGADGPLGEDGQRQTNAPVYPGASVEVLPGAGHLLPLERPREVAALIRRFWDDLAGTGPSVSRDYGRVIASSRTSTQTRAILARRAVADDPAYEPRILSPDQLATLRLVADRVVPQGGPAVDVAARVDGGLDRGYSDGWRNAALPSDQESYRLGLDALADFGTLDTAAQDATVQAIIDGEFEPRDGTLTTKQMTLWFEDCRVDLTRTWLSHPATMERIGFDGFANGGDVVRIQGFDLLGAGQRESWEPRMPAPAVATPAPASPAMTTATAEAAR